MKAYHVDRIEKLKQGQITNLIKYSDIEPNYLQEHVNFLFPNGVSSHGEQYFLDPNSIIRGKDPIIELIFEYVRRSYFKNLPSRFESVFAFGSIKDVKNYKCNFDGIVWEVESEKFFKADASYLDLGNSILCSSYNAHNYWSGLCSSEPQWELLLIPPVKVIKPIGKIKTTKTFVPL